MLQANKFSFRRFPRVKLYSTINSGNNDYYRTEFNFDLELLSLQKGKYKFDSNYLKKNIYNDLFEAKCFHNYLYKDSTSLADLDSPNNYQIPAATKYNKDYEGIGAYLGISQTKKYWTFCVLPNIEDGGVKCKYYR